MHRHPHADKEHQNAPRIITNDSLYRIQRPAGRLGHTRGHCNDGAGGNASAVDAETYPVGDFLTCPLSDVGTDLPKGELFREVLEHVCKSEYVKEGKEVLTPEMFVVKLSSTLEQWKSGGNPGVYEDLIAPLTQAPVERRLNLTAPGGTASPFYNTGSVKASNKHWPSAKGSVQRLSIIALTAL